MEIHVCQFRIRDLNLSWIKLPVKVSPHPEPQGQRSLSCCYSKDFQHEVFAPPATLAFHGYTVAARMLLQQ
jgi:hypothetical protein